MSHFPIDNEIYYIFFNPKNPIQIHNFNISKRIMSNAYERLSLFSSNGDLLDKYLNGSINYMPFDYIGSDLETLSEFGFSVTKKFFCEYDAEWCRKKNFSKLPSRLSCIFVFKDTESINNAIYRYGWNRNELKIFKLLPSPINRVAKLNMSIVSFLLSMYDKYPVSYSEVEGLWRAYWNGLDKVPNNYSMLYNLDSNLIADVNSIPVIWEYLIEGCLEVIE